MAPPIRRDHRIIRFGPQDRRLYSWPVGVELAVVVALRHASVYCRSGVPVVIAVPAADAVTGPFRVMLTAVDFDEGALPDEEIAAGTIRPHLLHEVDASIRHPQARERFAVRFVEVTDQAPPARHPSRRTREYGSELLRRQQPVMHDGACAGDCDIADLLGEYREQSIRQADPPRRAAQAAAVDPVHAHRIAGGKAPVTVERFAQSTGANRHGDVQLRAPRHP